MLHRKKANNNFWINPDTLILAGEQQQQEGICGEIWFCGIQRGLPCYRPGPLVSPNTLPCLTRPTLVNILTKYSSQHSTNQNFLWNKKYIIFIWNKDQVHFLPWCHWTMCSCKITIIRCILICLVLLVHLCVWKGWGTWKQTAFETLVWAICQAPIYRQAMLKLRVNVHGRTVRLGRK